jgi:hypothetical protein
MPKNSLRLASFVTALAVLATAGTACASGPQPQPVAGRLFRVVNASFDSMTGMEVADASTSEGAYIAIDLGEPLQGGLTSTTVRLPDGGCRRDMHVTFRDGRSEVYRGIDVCKVTGVRLSPMNRLLQNAPGSTGVAVTSRVPG